MIRMNGGACGEKKKTTDEPMPSTGRTCISMPSCCPRGSSGGASNVNSSAGTSGGRDRGGRFTTIWLTGAPIPRYGRAEAGWVRTDAPVAACARTPVRATAILLADLRHPSR